MIYFLLQLPQQFVCRIPGQNNHWVISKIRLLWYFNDGHRMSPRRSSNTPSKKTGYFERSCAHPVVHRVIFMTFFVRGKLGVGNLYDRD
jgi:hypothetical protein